MVYEIERQYRFNINNLYLDASIEIFKCKEKISFSCCAFEVTGFMFLMIYCYLCTVSSSEY